VARKLQVSRKLCAAAKLATFALAQATPDAETLVVRESVFEAFAANFAGGANLLRVASGATLFREERLRVSLCTECICLPCEGVVVNVYVAR
jgi:hypothetical protein